MSTATITSRPAQAGTANGGVPARRAVIRWAWRLFRREWRQQLLVLGLLTVAVAATIWGAGVATNTPPPATATFGTATAAISLPGGEPHLAALVVQIQRHYGPIDPRAATPSICRQQRSTTLTSHGHAAGSTAAPQTSNRGGRADRTGIMFPQPPRDPDHRSRARRWSPAAPRKPDAVAPQLTAVSRGSRR